MRRITSQHQQLQQIHHEATTTYAEIVHTLLSTQCQDTDFIGKVLDRLIDHCPYPPALTLYHSLSQYLHAYFPDRAHEYLDHYPDRHCRVAFADNTLPITADGGQSFIFDGDRPWEWGQPPQLTPCSPDEL